MKDILQQIVENKKSEVALRKKNIPQESLINNEPARGFIDRIRTQYLSSKNAVIAEIKKASPSKGLICQNFNPIEIAQKYQQGGASCLSVLTDEKYFQGSDDYFLEVRKACPLPMLRKDFIIDAYQIFESKSLGADCILLIAAILDDQQLQTFTQLAHQLDMDVLLETHDESELDRALQLNTQQDSNHLLLGINNRNLKTFETSLNTTIKLLKKVPDELLLVTESGIHTRDDVLLMNQHGIRAFLVGESLMRANEPDLAIKQLFSV